MLRVVLDMHIGSNFLRHWFYLWQNELQWNSTVNWNHNKNREIFIAISVSVLCYKIHIGSSNYPSRDHKVSNVKCEV